MAGGPIYLRALEKIGVGDTVAALGIYNKNVMVNSSWVPLEAASADEATEDVTAAAESRLGSFITERSARIKSRSHFWNLEGLPPITGPTASRGYFQAMEGIEGEIVYLEGSAPTDNIEVVGDVRIVEAAIHHSRVQRKHGNDVITMRIGDVVDLVSESRGVGMVKARITGIFRETNPGSEFWLGVPSAILEPPSAEAVEGQDLPLVLHTTWDGITRGAGPSNAGLPADYNWVFFIDSGKLSNASTADMLARVRGFENQVMKDIVRPIVITSIDSSFERLEQKIVFVRIPMFLLAALTVVIVGYYLFLVSGILSRKRESETVMLRSRGLSVWQVFRLEALECLLLISIPVALGPLAAAAAVWQMGRLPVFDSVTAGGTLSVELTWRAWAWSAAAGLAAALVLLIPALLAARRGVTEDRAAESRPDRPPLFQRYYLDILFLVLGGLIWWELDSRGSVISTGRDGTQSADFTLLFAPAIFLLVVALVFLRLFPLVAKAVSSVASRSGSAAVSVGFWRLGRRPYWYSWPIMLLVLAGGLGVLAGTLASTLERSSEEQVLYESGADLHVLVSGLGATVTPQIQQAVQDIDGVNLATRAYRTGATLGTTTAGPQFGVLAVDANEFPQVGWLRDDFSDSDIATLLRRVDVPVKPEPIFLPDGTERLSMWARQDPFVIDHFLWLVIRDATGRTATVTMSQIGAEWTEQFADVPPQFVDPIEVVSIQTFMQAGGDGGAPTSLYLDDLTAIGPGFAQVVIDFDERGQWTGLPTSNGLDTLYSTAIEPPGIGREGGLVAHVTMDRGTNSGIRGIYRTATGGPLPVIASESFVSGTNTPVGTPFVASVGGGFVPLVVVDTVRYFPTFDPSRGPFVVADVSSLIEFIELRGLRYAGANELFASIDTTRHVQIRDQVRSILRSAQIIDRQQMLDDATVDPLAVAGWRGMGVVALVLAGVATTLGYVTYLSAHSRNTQHDSAYMRAIGLSRREFMGIVIIEHALIGLLGVALGILTGIGVSRIAVSSMAFTETGGRLLPPFILQTNWAPVGIVLAIAAATALVILAGVLRAYPRLPLHVLTRGRS